MIKQIIRYFKSFNSKSYANVDMTKLAKKKRSEDEKLIDKINKEKRC